MATKTPTYTPEMVEILNAEYTAARDAGKPNAEILAALSEKLDRTIPSLRAKLMQEKVYVKDTDAEKDAKAEKSVPRASEKAPKVTKLDVAKAIVAKLGVMVDAETLRDLTKVKAATLAMLAAAVKADKAE